MTSLGRENVHVIVVVSLMEAVTLMEAEWSCYRGGHSWGKNGHATDVASLRMGENGHVTEVTLVEIEGSLQM